MVAAWSRQRWPRYRLIRPIVFSAVDGAEWLNTWRGEGNQRTWDKLHGVELGDEGRQAIVRRWLFLRFYFRVELAIRGAP